VAAPTSISQRKLYLEDTRLSICHEGVGGEHFRPAWSPDGQRIPFFSDRDPHQCVSGYDRARAVRRIADTNESCRNNQARLHSHRDSQKALRRGRGCRPPTTRIGGLGSGNSPNVSATCSGPYRCCGCTSICGSICATRLFADSALTVGPAAVQIHVDRSELEVRMIPFVPPREVQ
jgi:hypothetical protein